MVKIPTADNPTISRYHNSETGIIRTCGVDVVLVLHFKGEHAQQHHKQQHARRPHVHLLAVIARPAQKLKSATKVRQHHKHAQQHHKHAQQHAKQQHTHTSTFFPS